ncbi:hypothetical protein AALB53_12515 [Lachnospiraceae bacterium 47-T17]
MRARQNEKQISSNNLAQDFVLAAKSWAELWFMYCRCFGLCLGIEMNSGHSVYFTATGDDGVKALKKLQDEIEDADMHQDMIYFNMNDYNISVRNNDGIINTGDFTNNAYQKREQDNL